MILLAAMPSKWEMLISICLNSLADISDLDLRDTCDTIVTQYETEQMRGGKGKQQQHANKLSAVKWKHGNQNFSNQESGGSQQKPEDCLKRKHRGCLTERHVDLASKANQIEEKARLLQKPPDTLVIHNRAYCSITAPCTVCG
jgi:hypothetical protein